MKSGRLQSTIRQAFPAKVGSSKGLDGKMAIDPHQRLKGDSEALRYLAEERRLTMETINSFNSDWR